MRSPRDESAHLAYEAKRAILVRLAANGAYRRTDPQQRKGTIRIDGLDWVFSAVLALFFLIVGVFQPFL